MHRQGSGLLGLDLGSCTGTGTRKPKPHAASLTGTRALVVAVAVWQRVPRQKKGTTST
jgi:hypothetical protein